MRKKLSLHEKLWSKIRKGGLNECWPWIGCVIKTPSGNCYGRLEFRVGPRSLDRKVQVVASKLVYEEVNGPLPPGRETCHKCNNSLCCNPAHLYAGTHQENMDDMKLSGRSLNGTRNPRAVLTKVQIREAIRRRFAGETYKQIGDSFGVHLATIHILCKKAGACGEDRTPTPSRAMRPKRIVYAKFHHAGSKD